MIYFIGNQTQKSQILKIRKILNVSPNNWSVVKFHFHLLSLMTKKEKKKEKPSHLRGWTQQMFDFFA